MAKKREIREGAEVIIIPEDYVKGDVKITGVVVSNKNGEMKVVDTTGNVNFKLIDEKWRLKASNEFTSEQGFDIKEKK
jgi:regulator of RNase E activity RraA